jgi:hypothetical protein
MAKNESATGSGKTSGNEGDELDNVGKEGEGEESGESQPQEKPEKKGKTFTQEQLDKIVTKRLADAKKQFEKDKDLSESERLKAENERLSKQLNERNAFDDFDSFFGKKGVKNTRGLFRAMKSDLEFDDKGKLANLKDLLDDAKNDFAEFFPRTDTDADGKKGKNDDGQTSSFSDVIRKGFGR